MTPLPPADELLVELGLPEHAPVEQLQQLTRIAAVLCGTPSAVVNLLDGCFQHQAGAHGFDGARSPLADSMCAVALQQPRLRHVPDAALEPAFASNPWVDGRLAQVRFYASAPMTLSDGRAFGSLCVFSEEPGSLSGEQRAALAALADQAVALIEHARASREAQAQAALLRLVAEGSVDVLSRHRPDGTVLWVSPSVRTVLGVAPEDELGALAVDRVHPADRGAMAGALQAVLAGSLDATALVRSRHADGSWRWLEIRVAPIRDELGSIVELHSAARDVSARVQAERSRAESEQRYRTVVEQSPEAIVVHVGGQIAFANPSAAELVGATSPEQLVGMAVERFTDPDRRDVLVARIAAALQGKSAPALRQRIRRLDGSWVPVEVSGARVELDGRVGVQNVIRDVTEDEAARRALEHAHAELAVAHAEAERRGALTAAVLDTIDVGVLACDASGGLTLVNRAAREIHGLDPEPPADPVDLTGDWLLLAEDGATVMSPDELPLRRTLAEGEVHDAVVVVALEPRPARTLRCDGRELRDGAGRLLGAVVAMKDVTEARARAADLVQARDEARAATRAKTAFLAAASHEIRTPLNGILGALELLAAEHLPTLQEQYVDVARSSGESLLALLNDVLDLSKAETTAVTLLAQPMLVGAVAEDVVTALRAVARRKGLDVRLQQDDALLVLGDAGRLRQVLMNLLGNAIKFTTEGEVAVAVTTRVVEDGVVRVRVDVSDTGAGMEELEVATLFQPFVQGRQGQLCGGTGLGLALSQQLVELMGGQLSVHSEPGVGSVFTVDVDLPQAPVAPAPRTGAEWLPPAVGQPALRVLLADDNDVNLMVAEAMLVSLGAEVVTVHDGDEAVAAVSAGAFDLVLLDNRMPRMSGIEAAEAIRLLPGAAGRTAMVALTAGMTEQERTGFAEAGVPDVLLKPVRSRDLEQALDRLRTPAQRFVL